MELIKESFAAIHKSNSDLKCFITLTEEQALEEAAERDRELAQGVDRGPLHGIPIAHKDLLFTRGVKTTGGSLVFRDFVPEFDATVVQRLRSAGAISVGKTNLHELAYGITSKNPHYGMVRNPLDRERIAGGSSGGSAAAIAAGWIPVATGTDTGGSIRIPASYCGVTGLKPTFGRVSRYGVLPLAYSLDHVGPLGSCVEDCALAMNAMAGPDDLDESCAKAAVPDFNLPSLADLRGVRVGIPQDPLCEKLDESVAAQVKRAVGIVQQAGAVLERVKVTGLAEINPAALTILLAEASAVYADRHDQGRFGESIWRLLELGRAVPAYEYVAAGRLRAKLIREFDELWRKVDVIAIATTPIAAPLLEEETVQVGDEKGDVRAVSTQLVRAFNYLGFPALSLPVGRTASGLPAGLQLVSAPFSEPRLLQVARTVEERLC